MTPDMQGWLLCVRCGVWRLRNGVRELPTPGRYQCADDGVCSRMAEVGRGELDVKDDAP